MDNSKKRPGLKALSKRRFDKAQIDVFLAEVQSMSDRTVAIVWGALVEDALRVAIEKRMPHLAPNQVDHLFSTGGILESFSSKAKMALALNIITKAEYDDIDLIRDIRNVFAHAILAIDFTNQPIRDSCKLFGLLSERQGWENASSRAVFSWACLRLWQELLGMDGAFTMSLTEGTVSYWPDQRDAEPCP